jgi:hypothetical protein
MGLLLICILFSGCSGEEPMANPAPVTTTLPAAKYSAGDIVGRPAQVSGDASYLILGYDRISDQYERAWIYRNPDGNFGYRSDSRTDTSPRSTLEKVYTVKLSHVPVSSVPVSTPTVVTAATTIPRSVPLIQKISPDTAAKDTSVSVTISGSNFWDGATVKLLQSGHSPVKATALTVVSPMRIDCTFDLAGLDKGTANIIVTNPDGQYETMVNAFTIGTAGPLITSVYPGSMKTGEISQIAIYGQNFKDLFKVTLMQGTALLDCTNPVFQDATKIYCTLSVPASAKTGSWNLTVINVADQQTGQYIRPFTIINST